MWIELRLHEAVAKNKIWSLLKDFNCHIMPGIYMCRECVLTETSAQFIHSEENRSESRTAGLWITCESAAFPIVTTDTTGQDVGKQPFTSHAAGRPRNTRRPFHQTHYSTSSVGFLSSNLFEGIWWQRQSDTYAEHVTKAMLKKRKKERKEMIKVHCGSKGGINMTKRT